MIDLILDDQPASRYIEEILSQAGLAWRRVSTPSAPVTVLVGDGEADPNLFQDYVMQGGSLIACGGSWGLDELFGATGSKVDEGYFVLQPDEHPIGFDLPTSMHVWQGFGLQATSGAPIGRLLAADHEAELGAAIVTNRVGKGLAIQIGANIPVSVLHIQLGREIHEDGEPAPDGTAPIDDEILKTDDGVVLDWQHDRRQTSPPAPVPDCPGKAPEYPAGDTPWFAEPLADALRELLVQAIRWAARQTGQPLAWVHAWPGNLSAVGLISHDSDHNVDEGARTTLDLLAQGGITSTWCHIYSPQYTEGYQPETFDLIKAAGHEIALHYNSRPEEDCAWGREHLADHAARVKAEAWVDGFVSNKNHYLRWEGLVEFFHWLVDEGIQADQSKGPSKKGNVGYPHGSTLPWFPLDPATGEFIDVLEIPTQTQDLWLTAPAYLHEPMIAQAIRYQGVAHFLFHQAHLGFKPEVAKTMLEVIAAGKEAGLEWWRSEQINTWQRARRGLQVDCERIDEETVRVTVTNSQPISQPTISLSLPGDRHWKLAEGFQGWRGQDGSGHSFTLYPSELAAGEMSLIFRTTTPT